MNSIPKYFSRKIRTFFINVIQNQFLGLMTYLEQNDEHTELRRDQTAALVGTHNLFWNPPNVNNCHINLMTL